MSQDDIRENLGDQIESGDVESGIAGDEHPEVIYALPWEGLREDQAKQLTKEVFGLSADEDSLLASPEELEYAFDFDVD